MSSFLRKKHPENRDGNSPEGYQEGPPIRDFRKRPTEDQLKPRETREAKDQVKEKEERVRRLIEQLEIELSEIRGILVSEPKAEPQRPQDA